MSCAETVTLSNAEINQQALANASALPYLMVAFARACGRSPEEAASFAGHIFAPGWVKFAGQGADTILRAITLNLVCCGGEIEDFSGDHNLAEARVSGVPVQDEAEFFGITCEEADRFSDIFGPIADSLGFDYSWHRDGPTLALALRRQDFGR